MIELFLEDEADFALISENLISDLDAEEGGKIIKGETHTGQPQNTSSPSQFMKVFCFWLY